MIKSPLRYPGGKSRAANVITGLFPDFAEFREPFAGGGSVVIRAKQIFPQRAFWMNDLDLPLFQFWKCAQSGSISLSRSIRALRKRFADGKELFAFLKTNFQRFDREERAAAYFILNRITFSGTTLSGGFSQNAFKERFTESSIKRLEDVSQVLKGIKITCGDYQDLIDSPGENVMIYLDPPYHSTKKSRLYGKNGDLHRSFDYQRFANAVKNCPHRWLITCGDSEFVRDLFSFAKIVPYDLTYGMKNVGGKSDQNGRELLISNYL